MKLKRTISSEKVNLSFEDRNKLVAFVSLLVQIDKRVKRDKKAQKMKTKEAKITSIYLDQGPSKKRVFLFSLDWCTFNQSNPLALFQGNQHHGRYNSSLARLRYVSDY